MEESSGYWHIFKTALLRPWVRSLHPLSLQRKHPFSVLFFSKKWKALAQSHFLLVSLLYYYYYLQLCRKASLCSVVYKHTGKIGPLQKKVPQKALHVSSQRKKLVFKCHQHRELFMPMATSLHILEFIFFFIGKWVGSGCRQQNSLFM